MNSTPLIVNSDEVFSDLLRRYAVFAALNNADKVCCLVLGKQQIAQHYNRRIRGKSDLFFAKGMEKSRKLFFKIRVIF